MKKIAPSLFSWPRQFPFRRRPGVLLVALGLCALVSCGQNQPAPSAMAAQPNAKLENAAMSGELDSVKAMLAADPKLKNYRTGGGGTLLHVAADGGQREVVEFLLGEGIDIASRNTGGGTPLHRASAAGSREVVELLLAKGAEVNARNHSSETPLRQAEKNGHPEVADLLRQHGGTE